MFAMHIFLEKVVSKKPAILNHFVMLLKADVGLLEILLCAARTPALL